jgi:hypothetical protein
MSSPAQIDANRRNSQKSTGPRSDEGKAVSRFNALKSGIHARSQVIPGEDAAELEDLAVDYRQQFQAETPLEVFLVDAMIRADWKLRRLQKIEARLWQEALAEDANLAHAYRDPALAEAQRRMEAAERSYYRALRQMQGLRKVEAKIEQARVKGQDQLLNSAIKAVKLGWSLPSKQTNAAEPAAKLAPRKDGGS